MSIKLLEIARSFTLRTALMTAALFALLVSLILGAAYLFAVRWPLQKIEDQVRTENLRLSESYQQLNDDAELVNELERLSDVEAPPQFYYLLLDSDKKLLAGNLPLSASAFAVPGLSRIEFETGVSENSAIVMTNHFEDGSRLVTGRDMEELDEREELITETLGWAALMSVLFGLISGILISFAVTRRLDSINKTARNVMDGKLDKRIPVNHSGDDFDNLSITLNAMLDRIETLIESVSRVSDNVAHELRTPLSRLTADLEDLEHYAQQKISDPQINAMIDQAHGQADRMQRIFTALLRIARLQSGENIAETHPLHIGQLVLEAVTMFEPMALARDIEMNFKMSRSGSDAELQISVDRDLVFQAVTNLIDNAIKFTPHSGQVDVRVFAGADYVEIEVSDTGPGVPSSEKSRLGERFYQPQKNSALTGSCDKQAGYGLGLALVKAVSELHGGTLSFPDCRTGLCCVIKLPRRTEDVQGSAGNIKGRPFA